ncbi:MAG: hypothetical protein KDD58_15285 [Bdellovibrionales bacterium]|nr:hypothetical protein [Bdellovibrionales bacterium]
MFLYLVSCQQQTKPLPTYDKYNKDTQLMINICNKLSKESDAKTLHKIAVSTLQARVVSCSDYFGECNQYGKFLSLAAELSKDQILTDLDRQELNNALRDLETKVRQGKARLK